VVDWKLVGVGLGTYPTIEDFRFGQEVVFSCDGRPFINYVSRSWLLDEEGERIKPLAIESGYWRPQPDNNVELLLAHPNGVAEIYVGTTEVLGLDDAKITSARAVLKTDVVTRTESAKPYTQGERLYGLLTPNWCGRSTWLQWVNQCKTTCRRSCALQLKICNCRGVQTVGRPTTRARLSHYPQRQLVLESVNRLGHGTPRGDPCFRPRNCLGSQPFNDLPNARGAGKRQSDHTHAHWSWRSCLPLAGRIPAHSPCL